MEINGIYQWIFGILYPLSYWIYGILGIFQPYLGYTMVYNHIWDIQHIWDILGIYNHIYGICHEHIGIYEYHIWNSFNPSLMAIFGILYPLSYWIYGILGIYLGYYGIYHIWNIFNVHITDHYLGYYTHYQSTSHIVPLTSRIQWTSKWVISRGPFNWDSFGL